MIKTKYFLLSIFIAVIILFFLYEHLNDEIDRSVSKIDRAKIHIDKLNLNYLTAVSTLSFEFDKDVKMVEEDGKLLSIQDFRGSNYFILRIHETDCEECIKSQMSFINGISNEIGKDNILLFGQFSSIRNLILYKERLGLHYRAFIVGSLKFGENNSIDEKYLPYLFVLSKSKATFLYFPDKSLPDSITKSYYGLVSSNVKFNKLPKLKNNN